MRPFAQLLIVAITFVELSGPVLAGERLPELEKFFGSYEGKTISKVTEGLSTRDLSIKIKPYKDTGFTVHWTTVLKKADGTNKTKSFKISFIESQRGGIYGSAMRRNAFGHAVPLNPLKGEPYVWSSVVGDLMVIRALYIAKDGGYEMQEYSRSLTKDGMTTRFARIRNGEQLKVITGELKRIE